MPGGCTEAGPRHGEGMSRNKKNPQPLRPSTVTYIGVGLALGPLLANSIADQVGGPAADPLVALGALVAHLGALVALLDGIKVYLGLDQPCEDRRCRRRPYRNLDCLNGRHDY